MSHSKYADEGTVAHALAAMALKEGRPASAFINRVITCEDYPHSELSPSGAARWMRCAGSTALETRIAFVPRKFEMTVTHDMAEGVQTYLDNIAQYITPEDIAEGRKAIFIEQDIDVSSFIGVPDHHGQGDVIILDFVAAEIQVHDLKFGRGVEVDAAENEQMQIYGGGALEMFADFAPDGGWKRFRGVIHQPRINPAPSEWDCSIEDLQLFGHKATAAASVALGAKALRESDPKRFEEQYLEPGDKQCRFCDAKATCPAIKRVVSETVLGDFKTLDDAEPSDVKESTENVSGVDNTNLARYLALVPLIEGWCSAIAAHAEAKLLAGEQVPGFKVVTGKKGNRKWSDDANAETTLKGMRLKHDQIYDYSVISPTSAEKLTKGDQAPLGDRQWKKLLGLITQSDGKPTVVPESDKRPALTIKPVADEFANLETEELV